MGSRTIILSYSDIIWFIFLKYPFSGCVGIGEEETNKGRMVKEILLLLVKAIKTVVQTIVTVDKTLDIDRGIYLTTYIQYGTRGSCLCEKSRRYKRQIYLKEI